MKRPNHHRKLFYHCKQQAIIEYEALKVKPTEAKPKNWITKRAMELFTAIRSDVKAMRAKQ